MPDELNPEPGLTEPGVIPREADCPMPAARRDVTRRRDGRWPDAPSALLAVDARSLRESKPFRRLWVGQLISLVGRQITLVAVPFQVYSLTHSALDVGLLGIVQAVPLICGSTRRRRDRRPLRPPARAARDPAWPGIVLGTARARRVHRSPAAARDLRDRGAGGAGGLRRLADAHGDHPEPRRRRPPRRVRSRSTSSCSRHA